MALLSGTFGIEETWLRKGMKEVSSNPAIFARNNRLLAQKELGMGNKQIDALKDWLAAANLLSMGEKIGLLKPSTVGEVIVKYDSTFSENGTFWLIHYFLSQNTDRLWFYYWYVNEFDADIFSRNDLEAGLSNYKATSEKIIKDFCLLPLLQTMRKTRLGKSFGIMMEESPNQFRRIEPPEDKLDPMIVSYITADWAKRNDRSSANLVELVSLKGSPGKILHLSPRRYSEYLDKIQSMFNKEVLWVSYTAGLNSVVFEQKVNPLDLLKAYYIKIRDEINPLDAHYRAMEE